MTSADIFAGLNPPYKTILADPPWQQYKAKVDRPLHYGRMSLDEICRLPVKGLAGKDCALFCWAIYPMLGQALRVIEAWDFRLVTVAFTWVKLNLKADTYFMGLGDWTRANSEICLFAVRGRPTRKRRDVRQLIVAHRREHSRKPAEQYSRIEALVDGPYAELFARSPRPGWDAWGNELDKFE